MTDGGLGRCRVHACGHPAGYRITETPRDWILCVQHYHWRDHIHEMADGTLVCDDDAGRADDAATLHGYW